ncbi:PASTA domain-containing protein [Streptomyces sp. NPDC047061]|uniref:Stk1 family PASTA domain-containing Ser/Thr kinase n=1 Tax=Streptomyces sp. NPDC047061 TaxID=3154605 RepID=UPI0033ED434F
MNLGGPDNSALSHPGHTPDQYAAGHGYGGSGNLSWDPAPSAQPSPMALVGGRYELRLLLGSGGMAEVHLAHDTRLDRSVALKTLRADLAHDPGFQARFRKEAQSTASLNDPSIVAVYDTGEDAYLPYGGGWDGAGLVLPYLVMEYVDGMTLRDVLYSSGTELTVERALQATAGVLRALAHSHHHGIVHRDIKPANVMMTQSGQVKVMDFGIARDTNDIGLTQTAAVLGTAQYLSPEQALGEEIDARSDLYSVGCLLYELLTRRPPFYGDSPMSVMYQHLQEPPQPPSLYNPEVDARVDAVVLRALEKDRTHRYQSATEMLADIEACLGTGAPAGIEPLPDEEGNGGGRKGTTVLIVAGVVVAIAAVLCGRLLFGRGHADDGKSDVPNLVGKTVEDARSSAENVGLTVTVTARKPCADQPKGRVCTQSPTDGRIAKGEAVSVTVSNGAPKVEVPDVTDKNEDDASRILEDKGFKVKATHVESTEDPGTVLKQDPDGGEEAEKGTEITLTVAKAAAKSEVPDLTGSTLSEARKLLSEQNLKLGDTTEVESSAEPGTVVGQGIQAGEEVEPGTAIDVKLAKAEQTVQIPTDIVGETLGEVQSELNGLGLQVTVASGYPQSSDAVVTSSTPEAGSDVEVGSTVVVVTETTGDTSSGDGTTSGTTTSPSPTSTDSF